MDDLDRLLDDWLADPAGDDSALRARLAADPAARRRLVRRLLDEAALRRACAAGAVPAAWSWRVLRRPRIAGTLAVAAALLVALGASWFLPRRPATLGQIESGTVRVGGQVVRGVPAAADLVVEGSADAQLVLPDGTRVALSPGSRARLQAGTGRPALVDLHSGEGHFQVAKAEGEFTVGTEAGQVVALGTAFAVTVRGERERRTLVAVNQGAVRVDHAGGSCLLRAGDRQEFDRNGLRQRIKRGRFHAFDAGRGELLLELPPGGNLLALSCDAALSVRREGEGGTCLPGDIPARASVEAGLGGDGRVASLRLQRPSVRATLVEIDVAGRQIEVVDLDWGGGTLRLPVIPEARIARPCGPPLALDDLLPGSGLRLRLDPARSRVEEVQIRATPVSGW